MRHAPAPTSTAHLPAILRDRVSGQVLSFGLHDQSYAVELLRVLEIIPYAPPTALPMTPAFVHGVINLRGRAVPVIDLALRFGGQAMRLRPRTAIVILEVGAHSVGVLVDEVHAVLDIDVSRLEAAPSLGAGLRRDFIRGMARDERAGFIVVLDLERLFHAEELDGYAPAASLEQSDAQGSFG